MWGVTLGPVTGKLLDEFPAHVRAYDLLTSGGEDLRGEPFSVRRARLEGVITKLDHARVDISPLVPFGDWEDFPDWASDRPRSSPRCR